LTKVRIDAHACPKKRKKNFTQQINELKLYTKHVPHVHNKIIYYIWSRYIIIYKFVDIRK
jgi:hypothetical protein